MPWSRVLYVVWSVIGIVVGLYISPMKILVALGLLFLVVISFFLFRDAANEWFQARGFMLTREVPPSERR
jgi:CHASE2 domain-containing sensor protein